MAGVLHQEQLGRQRKGLVSGGTLKFIAGGLREPLRMDGQGLAQVERATGEQSGSV